MTSSTHEGQMPRLPSSILLVDDDADSRELLGELLQGQGFDVHALERALAQAGGSSSQTTDR